MFGQKKVVRKTISRSKGAGSIGYTGFSDSQSEGIEPLIAPTEISQRKFGQITFKIVQNNTAQKAGHGKVNFLPSDINQKADIIVKQNRLLMLNSINPTQYRDTLGNLTKPIKQILSKEGQNDIEIFKTFQRIEEINMEMENGNFKHIHEFYSLNENCFKHFVIFKELTSSKTI